MQNLEEQLQKEISGLTEKVRQHQTEVIFCLRKFEVPGKIIGGARGVEEGKQYFYYETGIINGEMQRKENPEMLFIDLPDWHVRKEGESKPYGHIAGTYFLQVNRKMAGFTNPFSEKMKFSFDIKDLEDLKQGNLLIGLSDLSYNLSGTNLLIGDEEVENFLKEKRVENYPELLEILKNPSAAEGRINEHYSQETKRLGEQIVLTSNEIANAFRKIKNLEGGVMCASFSYNFDAGGRCWNKDEVQKYVRLRDEVLPKIEELKTYMIKAEDPKLFKSKNFSFLDGETIGFPAKLLAGTYLTWAKDSFIPSLYKEFEKLDAHLKEERQKANS